MGERKELVATVVVLGLIALAMYFGLSEFQMAILGH